MLFLGFLPRKAGARRKIIEAQRGRRESFTLFESPRRVAQTLLEIFDILGDRPACLARELTKRHEEVVRDSVSALAHRYKTEEPRGECTLVIGGASEDEVGEPAWSDGEVENAIRDCLEAGDSVRDLATELAERSGWPRREIYARANALRDERGQSN